MPASASSQAAAAVRLAESMSGQVLLGRTLIEPGQRLSSGLSRVDAVLGGGLPRGRLSEFAGALSSGKTSCLLALLAATTRRGGVVAWVDVADALHPQSAARAGVVLQRLLWVRPAAVAEAFRCAEILLRGGGFSLVVLDLGTEARPWRQAVWSRLLRVAEQSHTALVVLAPQRVAGSFAVLSLGLQPCAVRWRPGLHPLFDGYDATVLVLRNKTGAAGRKVVIRVRDWCSGEQPPPLSSPVHGNVHGGGVPSPPPLPTAATGEG